MRYGLPVGLQKSHGLWTFVAPVSTHRTSQCSIRSGALHPERLTLAFEGNGHTQAELVPERCAFPTLDPGDCPDASLQLVVLWIVA